MDAHHALRAVSSGKQPGAGPQPASSGLSSCVTPPATTSQQPAQLGTHNSVFTMDTASHGESASNSTLNSPSQPINLAADTALGATSAHLPHTGLQLPPLRSYKSHSTMNPASPSFRQNRHPFLIGVAGGTASGKTTVRAGLDSMHAWQGDHEARGKQGACKARAGSPWQQLRSITVADKDASGM